MVEINLCWREPRLQRPSHSVRVFHFRMKPWQGLTRRILFTHASHWHWWRTRAGTVPITAWHSHSAGARTLVVTLQWRAAKSGWTIRQEGECILWGLWLSQQCCWRFKTSGMWPCIIGLATPSVWKDTLSRMYCFQSCFCFQIFSLFSMNIKQTAVCTVFILPKVWCVCNETNTVLCTIFRSPNNMSVNWRSSHCFSSSVQDTSLV
jgi:hypothetical protein